MLKDRIYFLDIVNVLSALAVVFLHVNGCFWKYSGEESLSWWKSADVIESVFYFAVPLFFMISGSTLLDYNNKYSLKEFAKKRIAKTFIPYLIWSIIGLVINLLLLKTISISDLNIKFIIKGLIENSFVGVYWFFTPLFCVYLSIPLIAAVEKDNKIQIYTYCMIAALIINIVIPFVLNILNLGIGWGYQIAVSSGYLFYVFAGYVLSRCDISFFCRVGIYVLSIVGLLVHIFGTYYLTIRDNAINSTYKGYNNLPCVVYSLGVFILIKNISSKANNKIIGLFTSLSKYTFGIYLIHIFVINGFERITGLDNTSLLYRLIVPFIIFFVAAGICWIIKKIPVIKRIMP